MRFFASLFFFQRYGNRTYNINNKHTVHLTSSQLADMEAFPNDVSYDSKFTYYLLKAIYGTEVLASSSRTGRKCNSIKGAVSKPPLDPDLLNFIKSESFLYVHVGAIAEYKIYT